MQALLVDDSRAVRRLLSGMLRELGFDTAEAANGREALDKLRQTPPPDVALIDWNMPEMNGLELVQALRGAAEWQSLPLLMVTSETELERIVEAITAGANEYVMKPFDRETIEAKLRLVGVLE